MVVPVVKTKLSAEQASPAKPSGSLRGEPTIAETWPELAPFDLSKVEFPSRWHQAVRQSQKGYELPKESLKQRIHDVRQAIRFIGTLEPPSISIEEVKQWEALFKKLTGIEIKLIRKDPAKPDSDESPPLFKYIAPKKYEASLALLCGDSLPLRNSHIAIVLSWIVADNMYHRVKASLLLSPLVKLAELSTSAALNSVMKNYDATSQELLTAMVFYPLYKLHFKRKTKNLHIAPETAMEEIRTEFVKHHGKRGGVLLAAAEIIAKEVGGKIPHPWGVSQFSASKRIALGAAKFGGSELAIASALFSQIDNSLIEAQIKSMIGKDKLYNQLLTACKLASAHQAMEHPFQIALPAQPERSSRFLDDLQRLFLQRLRICHNNLSAGGFGSSIEDIYMLHSAVVLEKAGFLTPARKSEETRRYANQILLLEAPLAERLGQYDMAEALGTTAARVKFPLRFHGLQVIAREETGMNFRERIEWHEEAKARLRTALIAEGLEGGREATHDSPAVPPAFEIHGGPKRIYKAVLKLADELFTGKRQEADAPFLKDLFRLRVIIKEPSKLKDAGDRAWSPSELVEILQRRLPQLLGSPDREAKLIKHQSEIWYNNKLRTEHPRIPGRQINLEFQIMTGRFFREIYERGLPNIKGLIYGSRAHWARQSERDLRVVLGDGLAQGLPSREVGFTTRQLFDSEPLNPRLTILKKLESLSARSSDLVCIEVGFSEKRAYDILGTQNLAEGFPSLAKSYSNYREKRNGISLVHSPTAFDVLLDPDFGADHTTCSLFRIISTQKGFVLNLVPWDERVVSGERYIIAKNTISTELSAALHTRLEESCASYRARIWLKPNSPEQADLLASGKDKIKSWLNIDPEKHRHDILSHFGLKNLNELYQGVSQLVIRKVDLEKWLFQSFVDIKCRFDPQKAVVWVEFDEAGRGTMRDVLAVCRRANLFPSEITAAVGTELQRKTLTLRFSKEDLADGQLEALAQEFQLIRRKRQEEPAVRYGFPRQIETFVHEGGLVELTAALAKAGINLGRTWLERDGDLFLFKAEIAGPDAFLDTDETELHENTREDIETILRGLTFETHDPNAPQRKKQVPACSHIEVTQLI